MSVYNVSKGRRHPFLVETDRAEGRLRNCADRRTWPTEIEKIAVQLTRTHGPQFADVVRFALMHRLGKDALPVRRCRHRGCTGEAHSRGLCQGHYGKWYREELKRRQRETERAWLTEPLFPRRTRVA